MNRVRLVVVALALGGLLAGCTSGSTQAAKGADAGLAGKWYGTLKPIGKLDETNKALAAMMGNAQVDLELGADGKFKMAMMGTDIEGGYRIEKQTLTLTYEKVMGMDLKSPDPNSFVSAFAEEFKEPEKGEIRDGGKTLFFPGRKGLSGEAEMTFTREPPPAAPMGPKSVSPAEEKLVGRYVYDESFVVKLEGTKAQQSAQKMVNSMSRRFKLELRADNSFELEMMLPMRGKWKEKDGRVTLHVTEPNVKELTAGGPPDVPIKISDKPGQLLMVNDKTGRIDFALKREP